MAFAQGARETIASWDGPIDAGEAELLVTADIPGLYRHGVHPVLLAVASSSLGVSAEDARAALKRDHGLDEQGRPVNPERAL